MVIRNQVGGGLVAGAAIAALAAGALTMSDRAMASAPAPPPACVAPATTVVNDTTGGLINDSTTLTKTLPVSGAPNVLTDVDVQTFITHTWSGELDLSITSPRGTTVVLKRPTAPNPGAPGVVGDLNNVFNGTVWDDDAPKEAMGTVYADETLAPALVPEGALGAFVGENPNGNWTLRVQDTQPGDTGNLARWGLTINGIQSAPPLAVASPSLSPSTPIPDNGSPITSKITVSGANPYLWDLNLFTSISHTSPGDLTVTLKSPSGTVQTITSGNGGDVDAALQGTTWDDGTTGSVPPPVTAADFSNPPARMQPEGAMAAFMGENPNGEWTLTISDTVATDSGTLNSWELTVTSTAGCGIPGAPAGPPVTAVPLSVPKGPDKLVPRSLGLAVASRRDRSAPFRFAFSGLLKPPRGSTLAASCRGVVRVTIKNGRKTVTQRSFALKKVGRACRYSGTVVFARKPSGLGASGKLTATARYLGSANQKAVAAGRAVTLTLG